YHPDVNKDPDASQRFSEVTEAYDVLSDAEKRKQYDRFGHAGVGAQAAGGGAGPGPGGGSRVHWSTGGAQGFDPGDLNDIFEGIFGGGGGGMGGSPFGASAREQARPGGSGFRSAAGPTPRAGRDISHTVTVTFMTAAFGGTENLRLTAEGGRTRDIEVRIPPGIEHGAKLRVRGQGHPGSNGGKAGDLILTVNVGKHPYFRRDGLNILLDVPITFAEAALGAELTIPLLEGTADIRIPPGTSSGRKLRLRGKGIKGADGRVGDFLTVVQIAAPEQLSENARRAIESLDSELQNPRDSAPWADQVSGRSKDAES
ncbi:MAG: J domain-containing protein, partial [Phycisphaerales bacterium]